MAKNEILTVSMLGRADNEWGCFCPHCGRPIFFAEGHISDIRGEQYQHSRVINLMTGQRCNGWVEVDSLAGYDRRMFD